MQSVSVPTSASTPSVICIGCGIQPSPKNRRSLASLDNDDVLHVKSLWKYLLEGQEVDSDEVEKIVSGNDMDRPAKMCAPCFKAYKTCWKQMVSLKAKLENACDIMGVKEVAATNVQDDAPSRKKPRLSSQHDIPSTSAVQSPTVAVSC